MKFACPKCSTRYTVADSKVPTDRTLRFTCKKCSNVFKIKRRPKTDAAPAEVKKEKTTATHDAAPAPNDFQDDGAQATRVANLNEIMSVKRRSKADGTQADPDEKVWYVLIKGKQDGPMTAAGVGKLLKKGTIAPRTYAWRDGMEDWKRLGSIEALGDTVGANVEPGWQVTGTGLTTRPPTPRAGKKSKKNGGTQKKKNISSDETVAMDASKLQRELKKIQDKPQEKARKSTLPVDTGAALAALVGRPTGEANNWDRREESSPGLDDFSPFGDEDSDASMDPALPTAEVPVRAGEDGGGPARFGERRDEYFKAEPGQETRIFMATAGIFRRRRRNMISAITGLTVSSLLAAVIGLDVAGYLEIPAMGLFYDRLGWEDPNANRALEVAEEKLEAPDISPEEREALEKKRAALRARLLGTDKAKTAEPPASPTGPKPTPEKQEVGIEEAKDVPKADHDLAAAIMADQRKTTRAPTIKPLAEIQAPNLPEGLTQEAITEVINQNRRAMGLCISQSMKAGENLSGKMEVKLTIGAKGLVKEATIETTRFQRTVIGNCTEKTVKRWRFPAFNGSPVTVIFPYVLQASF